MVDHSWMADNKKCQHIPISYLSILVGEPFATYIYIVGSITAISRHQGKEIEESSHHFHFLVSLQVNFLLRKKNLNSMPMTRTKVHPNAAASAASSDHDHVSKPSASVALTVWKKSLILNFDGFTVFDAKGNLVFRVDNYMASGKGQIFLMDASGKTLLTIRRKRLSFVENWLVFEGEDAVNPRYSVRKLVNILNSRSLAQVRAISFCGNDRNGNRMAAEKRMTYEIEGSYARRCCAVYDDRRRCVAESKRKEAVGGVAFGLDVFRLIVHEPGIDSAVAMALVIILDQMFGSSFHFQF